MGGPIRRPPESESREATGAGHQGYRRENDAPYPDIIAFSVVDREKVDDPILQADETKTA